MSTGRSATLVLLACVGCATAATPHLGGGDPDASVPGDSGRGGGGGGGDASLAPDATPPPDAAPDAASGACATPFTGVLATWDLDGEPGSQTSTAATSTASGVTAGSLARAASLTAQAGQDSLNASNWATSAQLDPTRYDTFSLAAPAGCTLALTSATIDLRASGTGPASAALGTSADGFAQTSVVAITETPTTATLSVTGAVGTIELRLFGYGATGAMGTLRIEHALTLHGSVQ